VSKTLHLLQSLALATTLQFAASRAQQPAATTVGATGANDPSVQNALAAIANDFMVAWQKQDMATISNILAPDFLFVGPHGVKTRTYTLNVLTHCTLGNFTLQDFQMRQTSADSAILLYALERDIIDAALVSYLEGDGSTWKAKPGVARTKEDIIASAGSRYTYSANTMAYDEAIESGAERLALVGMSCQSSVPPVMNQRRAGKAGRRMALNIGLLCSKTFDDAIFEELLEAKYGLKRAEIKKMNIKGRLQIWMHDGRYVEVPLKECHAFTREGCKMCPDFAAEHADISTGGIGAFNDWTLTIVRTDIGRELMDGLIRDGWIETRPGDDDPGAIALMHKLSTRSRKRWPEFAIDAPRVVPAPAAPAAS